jgi:hypothetical protein
MMERRKIYEIFVTRSKEVLLDYSEKFDKIKKFLSLK